MKSALTLGTIAAIGCLPSTVVSQGWTFPSFGWEPIVLTLPGSSYNKRSLPERRAEESKRWGAPNIYAACAWDNLVSEYDGHPINGFAYAGAAVFSQPPPPGCGTGTSARKRQSNSVACASSSSGLQFGGFSEYYSGPSISEQLVVASSAYNCCVQAQQNPNATLFYFTSNNKTLNGGQNCAILSTNVHPIPKNEVVLFAAGYNGSDHKSYGNYIGNGPNGPGATVALNMYNQALCAGSQSESQETSKNSGDTSAAGASAACSYTAPGVPDAGGSNPAGNGGSSAGSVSETSNKVRRWLGF